MMPIHKILLGAGAAVALLVAGAFVWLVLTKAHLETRLAEANVSIVAYRMANDAFAEKVAAQNRAVAQMKVASDAREKAAQRALEKAQKDALPFLKAAKKLRGDKLRGEVCAAAEKLFETEFEARR